MGTANFRYQGLLCREVQTVKYFISTFLYNHLEWQEEIGLKLQPMITLPYNLAQQLPCRWSVGYLGTHIHVSVLRSSGLCLGLPRWASTRTNLGFTEARDSEWQWHQLGHTQICTSPTTDNHASTSPPSFYRPDAFPTTHPTASKHWMQSSELATRASSWNHLQNVVELVSFNSDAELKWVIICVLLCELIKLVCHVSKVLCWNILLAVLQLLETGSNALCIVWVAIILCTLL